MQSHEEWDNIIERAEKEIARLKKYRALFENVEADFPCSLVVGAGGRLIIHDVAYLSDARALLRGVYGSWSDALGNQWFSCGTTITSWKNPDVHNMEIWLECSVEDYPPQLQSETCKWVKRQSTDEYSYVCAID
jgi:hypothetical protein